MSRFPWLRPAFLCVLLLSGFCVARPASAQDDEPVEPPSPSARRIRLDPGLAVYRPVSEEISGQLRLVGSDTMAKLVAAWAEGFRSYYADVEIRSQDKGSGTAVKALLAGEAEFGKMSRPLSPTEAAELQKHFGRAPTVVEVAIDLLVVAAHRDCPLEHTTLAELAGVFGNSDGPLTWGRLRAEDDWESAKLTLHGRDADSGTQAFFREHVLGKAEFRTGVTAHADAEGVVKAVAADKFALGYTGLGQLAGRDDVRPLDLSAKPGLRPVAPTQENAEAGRYPLTRKMVLVFDRKPGAAIDPLRREFLRYALSRAGQEIAIKYGFLPLSARAASEQLKRLGIR